MGRVYIIPSSLSVSVVLQTDDLCAVLQQAGDRGGQW